MSNRDRVVELMGDSENTIQELTEQIERLAGIVIANEDDFEIADKIRIMSGYYTDNIAYTLVQSTRKGGIYRVSVALFDSEDRYIFVITKDNKSYYNAVNEAYNDLLAFSGNMKGKEYEDED
jgi:hypothetical protein